MSAWTGARGEWWSTQRRIALLVVVVTVLMVSLSALHSARASTSFSPSLDRVVPLTGELVLRGELRSALDGSTFDAVTQHDRFPALSGGGASARLGGLYDPDAGGLRVVEQDPEQHVYRLAPNGKMGVACRLAGVDEPCLVPRLAALAHERLVTADELAATLSGHIEADLLPGAGLPRPSVSQTRALLWLAGFGALLGTWAQVRRGRRAQRQTTFGQVRVAAAQARRALRGEPTLARARDRIPALLVRAEQLEGTRRDCVLRLARLDAAGLQRRRAAWAGSSAPDAPAALSALAVEAGEAEQLGADLAAAVAGMERIASVLRTLALRARADRGTRAVAADDDPVDALLGELALRDAAASEAEGAARVLAPARGQRDPCG